jgi:hypothetical protein
MELFCDPVPSLAPSDPFRELPPSIWWTYRFLSFPVVACSLSWSVIVFALRKLPKLPQRGFVRGLIGRTPASRRPTRG